MVGVVGHFFTGIEHMSTEQLVETVLGRTLVEPRPYQKRIVGKALDMFGGRYKNGAGEVETAAKSILIESPTGSGKTVMGQVTARALQHELPELVVGWVAMRRNLLAQAERENVSKQIGLENFHLVSMFDHAPEALVQARAEGKKILMVVDEAQHDAASSMAHLHNLLTPEFILGLSATPFRQDRVKLCFDKVIKDAGIHQLIQDGFLSQFDHYSIDNWNVETVAETYLREPERWGKSIFYFVDLERCFRCSNLLKRAGVRHEVVTGDSNVEEQLEAFREGRLPVLINCMKLTEGFDEPSLQTAFVRDSRKGCTMQMAGRAFRKFGGTRKQIVQSKQTHWPIIRTAMPVQQFTWQEDGWRSLSVNPLINLINSNTRLAIASVEVKMPEFLTKQKSKKARRIRF